jgi:hypothetical protein
LTWNGQLSQFPTGFGNRCRILDRKPVRQAVFKHFSLRDQLVAPRVERIRDSPLENPNQKSSIKSRDFRVLLEWILLDFCGIRPRTGFDPAGGSARTGLG